MRALDPYREREVEVDPSHPLLNGNFMAAARRAAGVGNTVSASCPALACTLVSPSALQPDAVQAKEILRALESQESRALQAGTGAGKTLISLWIAAMLLERNPERCVIYCCPTTFLVQQTTDVARSLFNEPQQQIASFLHLSRPKRDAIYQAGLGGKLVIATAHQIALDWERGALDPSKVTLLIIDEAHLNRGAEAAAILQERAQAAKIRTFQTSATLTERRNPSKADIALAEWELGVESLGIIKTGREANYGVDPRFVELSPTLAEAADGVADDFGSLLASLHNRLRDLPPSEGIETAVRKANSLLKKVRPSELNQSIPIANELEPLLLALKKAVTKNSEALRGLAPQDHKIIAECKRDYFSLLTLSHLHLLITEQPRVAALEYIGARIALARCEQSRPHLATLFPPGALPAWWHMLSANTPYEVINDLIPGDSSLSRLREWIETRLAKKDSASLSSQDVLDTFFSSKRALGLAAQELLVSETKDHPLLDAVVEHLLASRRPGSSTGRQTLVYGLDIIPTLYTAAFLDRKVGGPVAILTGKSGLNPKIRLAQQQLARSGEVRIICSTSVGGVGIDLAQLDELIHLSPGSKVVDANQIWGRVGRGATTPAKIRVFSTVYFRSWIRWIGLDRRLETIGERPPTTKGAQRKTRNPGPHGSKSLPTLWDAQ